MAKADPELARRLAHRRLTPYLIGMAVACVAVAIVVGVVWPVAGVEQGKVALLVIAALQIVNTSLWALVFDFGAANRLKKQDYRVEGVNSFDQGRAMTYRLVLIRSGLVRLIVNAGVLAVVLVMVVVIYVL